MTRTVDKTMTVDDVLHMARTSRPNVQYTHNVRKDAIAARHDDTAEWQMVAALLITGEWCEMGNLYINGEPCNRQEDWI